MSTILHISSIYPQDYATDASSDRSQHWRIRSIAKYAEKVSADAVIHDGNLFNSPPTEELLDRCRRHLSRLQANNIPFLLLTGETDVELSEYVSSLEADDLVSRLQPRWNIIGEVALFAHDATVEAPEDGFHYPAEGASNRIAAIYGDITTATNAASVKEYESEIGWSLDGILIGNQEKVLDYTNGGVRILSPGTPEYRDREYTLRIEGRDIPGVFCYTFGDEGIEVSPSDGEISPDDVDGQTNAIEDIPGVGPTRAKRLRRTGYTTVSQVADASILHLRRGSETGQDTAKLIREGARELQGRDDTVQASISAECGVERNKVTSAYSSIISRGGTFSDKEEALRERFSNDDSVMSLDNHSPAHLYSLYHSGFETLRDVAEVDISELTDAPYTSHQAKEIRSSARKVLGMPDDEPDTSSSADADELHICSGCGTKFEYENVLRKHSYSCSEAPKDESSSSESEDDEKVPDLSPCPLSEYYEVLRAMRDGIKILSPIITSGDESHPLHRYFSVIDQIITNKYKSPLMTGYSPQHQKRVDHSVNQYREKYGNGEWITDYQTIEIDPPEPEHEYIIENHADDQPHIVHPFSPQTNSRVPLTIRSEGELRAALELLAEFPAEPPTEVGNSQISETLPVFEIYEQVVEEPESVFLSSLAETINAQFPDQGVHFSCEKQSGDATKVEVFLKQDGVTHTLIIRNNRVEAWKVAHEGCETWEGIAEAYETKIGIFRAIGRAEKILSVEVSWEADEDGIKL